MSNTLPWLRHALRFSCISNGFGGLFGLLLPGIQTRLFYDAAAAPTGVALLDHRLLWGFVLVMGLCFGIASARPNEHRALVLAGAIGKLYAVGLWVVAFVDGTAAPLILGAALVDGVLGVVFALGYWRLRDAPTSKTLAVPVT